MSEPNTTVMYAGKIIQSPLSNKLALYFDKQDVKGQGTYFITP
jgi:hypothetical protein